MDKPFASLPVWAVILIMFGVGVFTYFVLRHITIEHVVECEDGVKYIHKGFGWNRMPFKDYDKLCKAGKKPAPKPEADADKK